MQKLFFDTFEAREARFQELVGVNMPRLHAGPGELFKDIYGMYHRGDRKEGRYGKRPVYILSNPADAFVYQTGLQELQAAALAAGHPAHSIDDVARDAAKKFKIIKDNLREPILRQPISTLSGGESVKLAFARASILKTINSELVVSSPFTWLSSENRSLYKELTDAFGESAVLLLLDGEDQEAVEEEKISPFRAIKELAFEVGCEGLSAQLSEGLTEGGGRRLARFRDWKGSLRSPCLMLGENGAGKSLFCKILAGAQRYSGKAIVTTKTGTRRPRLIFQDSISQCMCRDRELLLHEICCSAVQGQAGHKALTIRLATGIAAHSELLSSGPHSPMTFLASKLNLIAHRLDQDPSLLILDEPDWGISHNDALSLVANTVAIAHEKSVPVLIVSHKAWWSEVCRSTLTVTRSDVGRDFDIQIGRGSE